MRILCTVLLIVIFGCSDPNHSNVGEFENNPFVAETKARLLSTEGGKILWRAIEAHGGLNAWYNAGTSSYVWGFTDGLETKLTAHNRTRQVYHDILSMGDEAMPPDARMAWDGVNAWVYPDSLPVNPRFMATTGYYFQSIPFILADPGVRYEVLEEALLDSVEYHIVRATFDDGVGDAPGDHYTLYIHHETHIVNAIRYRSTFGKGRPPINENMSENLLYYKDYVTVDGLKVPTRFDAYGFSEGMKRDRYYGATSSAHSYTQPFNENRLLMPEGARIVPLPPSE